MNPHPGRFFQSAVQDPIPSWGIENVLRRAPHPPPPHHGTSKRVTQPPRGIRVIPRRGSNSTLTPSQTLKDCIGSLRSRRKGVTPSWCTVHPGETAPFAQQTGYPLPHSWYLSPTSMDHPSPASRKRKWYQEGAHPPPTPQGMYRIPYHVGGMVPRRRLPEGCPNPTLTPTAPGQTGKNVQ
jgi:hypothetical protein